jgi:hypothetical protein
MTPSPPPPAAPGPLSPGWPWRGGTPYPGPVTDLPIDDAAALAGAAHDAAENHQVIYLTDANGRRLAAIVPADVAAAGTAAVEALEEAADLEAARRAAEEPGPSVPHADVLADLAEDEAHARRTA